MLVFHRFPPAMLVRAGKSIVPPAASQWSGGSIDKPTGRIGSALSACSALSTLR
jgi:hypothetical protein